MKSNNEKLDSRPFHTIKIQTLEVQYHGHTVGSLCLSPDKRRCVFEYDREWLAYGFSISPLELPLKSDVFIAKPAPFNGSFGIFEDSLPDGYGRYLLKKMLDREGISDSSLTVLDRLSLVGEGGMGALCYVPVTKIGCEESVTDFDKLQSKALEVLREKQDKDAELLLFKSGNSGGARPKAVFSDADGHWLVKFRHTYDPEDIGRQEYEYNKTARAFGIDVPDFKLVNNKYFASRRFDIDSSGERVHMATAGGLLSLSLSQPFLDYSNLLALTGYLTQDSRQVEEMYRRMLFNYFTDNKDDHCKNFSFLVRGDHTSGWRWELAPAYDLTLCTEGYNGEHATSVNGTGLPTLKDFIDVGTRSKIPEKRCRELIDMMLSLPRHLLHYSFDRE